MLRGSERPRVCNVCGVPEGNVTGGVTFARPGSLCSPCAGLGFDWSPCKYCGQPVVWAECGARPVPVDCRQATDAPKLEPNIILVPGKDRPTALDTTPEAVRLQVQPGANGSLRAGVHHRRVCRAQVGP